MNNPYIMQPQNQDVGGLLPVFQSIAQQQALQNAALAQQNQLVNQAAQMPSSGFNPMAMAQALRGSNTPQAMTARDVQMSGLSTYNPLTQYQVSQQFGTDPYSQQSRMIAAQGF